MRKGDNQIGFPQGLYANTKASIEAFAGVPEGAVAYATDTNELGTYNGSVWTWGSGGAWGTITGTLSDQTDLQTELNGKQPIDGDLTAIAALSPSNDDIIQRKAGVWTNRTLAQYKADIHLNNINVDTMMTDSKDPTGWVDPSAITVSYDSAARTITLTGTLEYYWRGVKTTLTSPWTSSAHTATNGGWFLSSTDGTNFTWSTTVWTFDVLMVAFVNYGATYKFALRETHGLMQWQTHEELHTTIGTFKESGGTLSNYTLLSTTAANRRPDVAATHLHDEDNETTNAALTSKLYNKLYLAGSTPTITYTGETADIVPLLVNNPYYNAYAAPNWQQTLMANNSYMCVWLVAIPTTADTTSQTYRYTWVQGQSNGNLASQTALTPSDLNLAAFATEATEFVFLAKVIIRYTGGNWDLYSVTTLTGNRMLQVGSPAGAYLSSVAVDATLTGDGSLASPLTVVQSYVTLTGNQTVAGIKTFSDTTDSTNYTTGAVIVSGGVGIAKSVSINGNVGIGQAASASAGLFLLRTVIDTSGGVFGLNGGVFSNPASASSTSVIGAQVTARTNVANAQNHTGIIAGGLFTAYHRGSGTASNLTGGRFSITNDGGGTVTDAITLSVLSATNSSGTITNNYGILIGNQSVGGTLNYAIYTGTGLVRFGDDVSSTGSILSSHATKGIGYSTGAGGTVTQATNKATGVTLNKVTGLITMNNAALAADTTVTFTLTDSAIAATDTITLQHNSGGTAGAYTITAQPAAGSATISVRNITAGSLSEAIVIRFTVIKSVSA